MTEESHNNIRHKWGVNTENNLCRRCIAAAENHDARITVNNHQGYAKIKKWQSKFKNISVTQTINNMQTSSCIRDVVTRKSRVGGRLEEERTRQNRKKKNNHRKSQKTARPPEVVDRQRRRCRRSFYGVRSSRLYS